MSNFLKTSDHTRAELESLIEHAIELKTLGDKPKPLAGKCVALVFFDPSLRTRASMQVGIYELGGNAVILEPGNTSWTLEHREGVVMDGGNTEHVSEFVRVLDRYVSAIGVRAFADLKDWETERTDPVLNAFAKYATVPIINLESAMHHPCQAMADMMTIREHLGRDPTGRERAPRNGKVLLTWAWHPKPLPMAVPNSFALAAAQFGHDLRIAHPEGYRLDQELADEIEQQAAANGGSVEYTTDPYSAFDGVEVVYAKSWGSKDRYGETEKEIDFRAGLRADWRVDEEKMANTKDAIFMHCLPVRRNVIVTDAVIDSPRSVVIEEAENRLHVQKAILSSLVSQ